MSTSENSALEESILLIDRLIADLNEGRLCCEGGGGSPCSSRPQNDENTASAKGPKKNTKKEKKDKKSCDQSNSENQVKKAGGVAPSGGALEGAALFAKAKILVGRVAELVPHANSEKLYVAQVEVGPSEKRQIVAGLQKFCSVDELAGSLVCVVANLKTAKLGGELSEGMILASTSRESSDTVKPIRPPENSRVGEQVFLDGQDKADESAAVKTLKSDHWKKIAAGLHVQKGIACFERVPLKTSAGNIGAVGFPDESTIN